MVGQVELDLRQLDAVVRKPVPGQVEQLAGFKERLAGNAADVQAGATESAVAFSTQATFIPSWAARMAAT